MKCPHPLIEHLRLRANILKSFATNSAVLKSAHGKGITREFFVKEFLREHLPQEIDIGRGEVINSTAKRGPGDLDIVLHHRSMPKLTIGEGALFLAESVAAVIEVKSNLTGNHLTNAITKCADLASLERKQEDKTGFTVTGEHFKRFFMRPRTYIFAYKSPELDTLYKNLRGALQEKRLDPKEKGPDFICSLSKGCIIKKRSSLLEYEEEIKSGKVQEKDELILAPTRDDALLYFFLDLMQTIREVARVDFDLNSYFKLTDGKINHPPLVIPNVLNGGTIEETLR